MAQTIEERLAALEHETQRQKDYIAIANLMGRYQYLHTAGKMSQIGRELFASELPDAHSEYGPLGVFGPEKSLEFFDAMTESFTHGAGEVEPGLLELHQITTPVIEVAGDGKTAKAMWMSTGAILMQNDPAAPDGKSATWDSGKYAVDLIKLDGVWKIWHLHVCDLWRTDFDENPVTHAGLAQTGTTQAMIDDYHARQAAGEDVRPGGMPCPDAPTTFCYSYALDSHAPAEPRPPEPYETFAETFSY
jgi:hypothetical protein